MIDLVHLRNNQEAVRQALHKKEPSFDVDALIEKDRCVRELLLAVEEQRKIKNDLAKEASKSGMTSSLREQSLKIGEQLKKLEAELKEEETAFNKLYLACPNVPDQDLPEGNKESNFVAKEWGTKREFGFEPKHHMQLNETAHWFDLDVAARMSGGQFVLYLPEGAKIIYALTQMMLRNNVKHGFSVIVPPVLVRDQALYNSGNLPKFEGDFYRMEADGLCLIPTAEVSLTNMYAQEILSVEQLPVRHTAWTSCFRREAGGYGASERGLIRIHQFEKVELYSVCKPENSQQELDLIVSCAEKLLQDLELPYQITLLAGQDCSFSSARTYDVEVWLPGQKRFYEVSSCSNCTDFQARRSGIRYRATKDAKPQLVHTLNGSSLALPRLMVALMENFQEADGTISLPAKLKEVLATLW